MRLERARGPRPQRVPPWWCLQALARRPHALADGPAQRGKQQPLPRSCSQGGGPRGAGAEAEALGGAGAVVAGAFTTSLSVTTAEDEPCAPEEDVREEAVMAGAPAAEEEPCKPPDVSDMKESMNGGGGHFYPRSPGGRLRVRVCAGSKPSAMAPAAPALTTGR